MGDGECLRKGWLVPFLGGYDHHFSRFFFQAFNHHFYWYSQKLTFLLLLLAGIAILYTSDLVENIVSPPSS